MKTFTFHVALRYPLFHGSENAFLFLKQHKGLCANHVDRIMGNVVLLPHVDTFTKQTAVLSIVVI